MPAKKSAKKATPKSAAKDKPKSSKPKSASKPKVRLAHARARVRTLARVCSLTASPARARARARNLARNLARAEDNAAEGQGEGEGDELRVQGCQAQQGHEGALLAALRCAGPRRARTARSARAHVLARGAPTHAMQAFDKVVKSDKPAASKAKAKTKTAKPFA